MRSHKVLPDLLTAATVAARLDVTIRSVERWSQERRFGFPAKVKVGHRNYFRRVDVDAWLDEQTRASRAPDAAA
jgi:hypothetical protein